MKKILIIRLSSIGDIVLTTPVIRCLKQQIPGISLHFAVKQQFHDVIIANPYIDKIHVFSGDLRAFVNELRAERFDYIVDLHKNIRSVFIRSTLRVPSAGFPKLNLRKWLLVKFKIGSLPSVHIVDRYFKAAMKLEIKNDGKGLNYFIPSADEIKIGQLFPAAVETDYFAFVIGAKHVTKSLPENKIISLCSKIASPVILLGGLEDREKGERITSEAGGHIFNACGKLNINQSASVVKQASMVITHDTGLMHIAAAFKKDIISIWGNTIPEFGMYPYLPENPSKSHILEVKGLSCRPCSKLGYDICPEKHFKCMEEIPETEILRLAVSSQFPVRSSQSKN